MGLAAGFGNSAEAGVVAEEEVAGVEGFGLEGGAVGGDEEPVVDLVAEELDAAEGGKVSAEGGVVWRGGFGEDEPEAVVADRGGMVAEHEDEQVAGVDGEAGEHAADFGVKRGECVENEGVGRLFRVGHALG